MQEEIKKHIYNILGANIPLEDFSVDISPDISKGDITTNVYFIMRKLGVRYDGSEVVLEQGIKEIDGVSADYLVGELKKKNIPGIDNDNIKFLKPGHINFSFLKSHFEQEIKKLPEIFTTEFTDKKIITEFTDPNPFKQFHIGHLMSNAIGESVSRLYELGGADVTRVCYQGDIGPHVAKCIWGMMQQRAAFPEEQDSIEDKMRYLGDSYVYGSNQYEENPDAQAQIKDINKKLFEKSDPELQIYYDKGRAWSLEYFDTVYTKLGTSFKHLFFESETHSIGKAIVENNTSNGVFVKSEESDAIIYEGEKDGLHTRVFINSQGLPTYEAKELGLAMEKEELGDFDASIVVTASEQSDYFRVLLAVIAKIMPEVAAKTKHVAHGMMQFADGKMSSRKGNVITGDSLLAQVEEKVIEKIAERDYTEDEKANIVRSVSVGALKYSILKQAPGKNIIFDFEKSISFDGDSGPYIQYAYTRAQSILNKAEKIDINAQNKKETYDIEKILMRFEPIIKRAISELAPQHVAGYLIELAGAFNSWYAQEKIIGDENEAYKLLVTRKVAHTLERGLFALGISVPVRM